MAKKIDYTIELQRNVGVVPEKLDGSRGKTVRWWNRDNRGHLINFDEWPFVEVPQTITLPKGAKSKVFTIYVDLTKKGYPYSVTPEITKDGPPDVPEIIVGE